VPRAYEGIEGRKNKDMTKQENLIQIKYNTSKIHFFSKTKMPL
jgi:hypothetical protein